MTRPGRALGRASATATPPYGDAHGQRLAPVPAGKGCPMIALNHRPWPRGQAAMTVQRSLSCCSWPPGVTHIEPCTGATVVSAVRLCDGGGARSSARSCRPGQARTPRPFDWPPQGFQGVKGARSSGVLEKLNFYKGQRHGSHGQLRACSISNAVQSSAMLSPHCMGGMGVMRAVWWW